MVENALELSFFRASKVFGTEILKTNRDVVEKFCGFKVNGEFLLKLNSFVHHWKYANCGSDAVSESAIGAEEWNAFVLMRTLAFQMVLSSAEERIRLDLYSLALAAELCASTLTCSKVDDCGDLGELCDYTVSFHGKCRTAIPKRANKPWTGEPERVSPVKRVRNQFEGNKIQHFKEVLRKKVLVPPVRNCVFRMKKLELIQADVQYLWSSMSKVEEALVLLYCCENCDRLRALCTRPCDAGSCTCSPNVFYYLSRLGMLM